MQMLSSLVVTNFIIIFLFMSLAFIVGKSRQRLDTVDGAWGLGFVLLAWAVVVQAISLQTVLVAVLVSVWGLRLTGHLIRRSRGRGEDPRYQEMVKKWQGDVWLRAYFDIFLLQGFLIWIISLPIAATANDPLTHWQWLVIVGAIVWIVGFIIESIADQQLALFLRARRDPGVVLDQGLWRYSRHPNYFGELLQWWGIGIIALQASYGWIGIIGPLILTILIVFISGIPPIEKRRQGNKAYQEYKKHTSVLVPLPRH